ncbi:hypothetical protein JCGZ_04771 [Jatropha curcas]|uniref:Uncharacterized protein n=1 Tax=Jatropha curcas TaxID=180498 RepID=A0A067KT27_JATCU|nr:hypothetical protein JCGZ_04771 [Jatropha curcas]
MTTTANQTIPHFRGYFAAGVPGSFFHGRLFPRSSLHLMHTSTSLHWLSQMPEEILNNHSPVWNKGRIFYTNASDEVCKAYATQFEKDMEIFLDARAKELVGLVREVQVDSFNLPIYIPSAKEMTELVKRNSCFLIEGIELFKAFSANDVMTNGKTLTKHWRAALEGIISKHFGSGIVDELFDRFLKKMQEFSSQVQASLT